MRVQKRDGYRVIIGGPVPPQAAAITLGTTILVREQAAGSEELMAHELVHVRQFSELGPARFLVRYVGSYLRFRFSGYRHMAAYRRIPLEVEASWVSRLHKVSELEPGAAATSTAKHNGASGKRHAVAPRIPAMRGPWQRPRELQRMRS